MVSGIMPYDLITVRVHHPDPCDHTPGWGRAEEIYCPEEGAGASVIGGGGLNWEKG